MAIHKCFRWENIQKFWCDAAWLEHYSFIKARDVHYVSITQWKGRVKNKWPIVDTEIALMLISD